MVDAHSRRRPRVFPTISFDTCPILGAALGGMLMDCSVFDLLKRSAAIPSMPQVAVRFLEIIQNPDFAYRDMIDVLSTDPGTASEILRLANSPLFGVTRQITSLSQALTLLGLKRVRSLVLGRYIVDNIDQKNPPVVDISYYWRRSLATAVLAARLADPLDLELREEAFTSGLLSDVGVVILDEALPDLYQHISRQYCPHGQADLSGLEREMLNATHGEVSAVVLEHWRLPNVVCDAVRWHAGNEPETPGHDTRLARIVGAADRIGKYLCEAPVNFDEIGAACREAMAGIQLESSVLAKILFEIEPQIQEFASVLRIDVISSKVYTMIAQQLHDHLVEPATATNN